MKQLILSFLVSISLILIACQNNKTSETETSTTTKTAEKLTPEEEIPLIIKAWTGVYNNERQVKERSAAGDPVMSLGTDNMGWLQLTSHYIPINNPEIGEHLLYVEEFRDGIVDSTYRQRIYKLHVDSTDLKKVVMCTFKDKKKFVGACNDISMLDKLTNEDISPYPNICDLIVTTTAKGYTMKMEDKMCAFGGRYFDYKVKLEDDKYFCKDRIVDVDTDTVMMAVMDYQWHELDRT